MKSTTKFAAYVVFVLSHVIALAQDSTKTTSGIGKHIYERLAETQKEYNEVVKTGDSLQVAEISYIMGKRYQSVGDYYNAEKWFTRSLRILEPLGPSEALGKVYIFISDFLLKNNQFDEASQNIQKAILNFRNVGAKERLMTAYIMMSTIHRLGNKARLKQPKKYFRFTLDSADYYHQKADEIGKSIKKLTHEGNITFSNDYTFIHNDTNITIRALKKAYDNSLKQKDTYKLFSNASSLSEWNLSINNFSEAKTWLNKASYILDTSNSVAYEQKIGLLKLSIELHKKTHDYKNALKYHEQYDELILAGISNDRDGAISRLKIEYETQKKEIALKQQQRFTKLSIVLGLFALVASIIFFIFFRKYKIISSRNASLVDEQSHRLKNYLQQVASLIILQRIQLNDDKTKISLTETLHRIEAMAQVQRKLYDSERLVEIELGTYIPSLTESILQSYSMYNFQPKYEIDYFWLHVDQTIPLGLILNEVITNSCKYAFTSKLIDPSLSIKCKLNNGIVELRISDNGPGFELHETKGFGLKLLKAFSERLKGEYNFQDGGREFHLSFKRKTNLSNKK